MPSWMRWSAATSRPHFRAAMSSPSQWAKRSSVRAATSIAEPQAPDGKSTSEVVSQINASSATSNTRSAADVIGLASLDVGTSSTIAAVSARPSNLVSLLRSAQAVPRDGEPRKQSGLRKHCKLLMSTPAFSAAYANSSARPAASCCRSDWS